ncbi:hypothetical protein [Asticcacaulis sp. AC402]|uniref:HAAS signaling domain-containing protein n=1 Tax=Asticcacaulis sp. AC402 TaxID=1282361 RepID=UPI0003C3E05E|nr:hypothetical protein [Asticcacaulis sp. AC402]ESQ74217.1 hypothetical protein ABAC402_15535 [Asticcacaulis sp. AC402]
MTDRDTIETWLKALDAALITLPVSQRADVVAEARGHLEERLAAGLSAESALHGFGTAKTYAQGFVDQHALDTALNSKRIIVMVTTLAAFTSRSIIAFFGLLGALLFGSLALGSVVSIVLKMINPAAVGLWMEGKDSFILGTTSNPSVATELAGNWVYLIFVAMIVVGGFLARGSLIAAIRSIRNETIVG